MYSSGAHNCFMITRLMLIYKKYFLISYCDREAALAEASLQLWPAHNIHIVIYNNYISVSLVLNYNYISQNNEMSGNWEINDNYVCANMWQHNQQSTKCNE